MVYLLVSLLADWEPLAQVSRSGGKLSYQFSSNPKVILISLAAVISIPVFGGFIYFNDHLHRLLRKLKITTKTSRSNAWNHAFVTQDRYVIVTLKDGRRILGYPTMFSNDPEEGFVYLYNPAWVNDDKSHDEEPDYFESICYGFLLNRDNIDLIEFTLDPAERLTATQ